MKIKSAKQMRKITTKTNYQKLQESISFIESKIIEAAIKDHYMVSIDLARGSLVNHFVAPIVTVLKDKGYSVHIRHGSLGSTTITINWDNEPED